MTAIAARLAVLAAATALALAACVSGSDPEPAPPTAEPSMSATQDARADAMVEETMEAEPEDAMSEDAMEPVEVPEALQFTTTTLAGEDFDGASLAGQDAILWVWASWCPICQSEAPAVAAASEQLPDGVALYGLPGNADLASSQQFVEDYGLEGFEHVFTEDGSLWSNFGVSYQPALVLINDDGTFETMPGTDGALRVIDPATGAVTTTIPVIDAWEVPEEWQTAHPALTVVEGMAYVTDPATGTVHAVDYAGGEVWKSAEVGVEMNELTAVTG